jgi:2-oxoglutarate ferredoxin oxidoreductase subunit gamma
MHLVAMNRPSLEKFAPKVKPNGVILINSSLIPIDSGRDDVDEIKIPVNDLAIKVGSVRSANIVALAAFVARSRIVGMDSLRDCVREEFEKKANLIPLNMAAIDEGEKAAAERVS